MIVELVAQTQSGLSLFCLIHPWRVYNELTVWPAASWIDSSVSRALHRTGITELVGSIPVQAWIFFRLPFRNCLSCVNNCENP